MVLPGAVLFPSSLLPLFIFEPRYRGMLAWTLARDRMFCVAQLKSGREDWSSAADFHHVVGVGLVRACVEKEDGTSHLILQGLARVICTHFVQTHPFVIANIEVLPSIAPQTTETEVLSARVLEQCASFRAQGYNVPPSLDDQLAQVSDAGVLADIVAHAFLRDPDRRQSVLAAPHVASRLRLLLRHLSEELP